MMKQANTTLCFSSDWELGAILAAEEGCCLLEEEMGLNQTFLASLLLKDNW
jgi:hypothetical protein